MSQASLFVSPDPQFFDNSGNPLSGGILYFYEPGTANPKSVYSDSSGGVSIGTTIILDSAGRAKIWLVGYYRVILTDSLGVQIWTEDNVSSAYSPLAVAAVTFDQWQSQTDVLTFIGATQFSVPGDQTAKYLVGSRIKATVTAGTITGTITVAAAGGGPIKTTVTVLWDLSYALDAGLSAVWTGIVSAIASAMPIQVPLGAIMDWYKSMTGVPALSWGWVQCDGQTLSDPLSPMNGQVIPNLNGAAGGADTFANGKIAVYMRGGATSGTYSADSVIAHAHGVSAITVNAHTHTLASGTGTTDNPGNHTHTVTHQYQTVASGGSYGDMWQDGPSNPSTTSGAGGHTHNVTLSGNSGNASTNALTGNVDNNGAATETTPKTVTAVKIMRVK